MAATKKTRTLRVAHTGQLVARRTTNITHTAKAKLAKVGNVIESQTRNREKKGNQQGKEKSRNTCREENS